MASDNILRLKNEHSDFKHLHYWISPDYPGLNPEFSGFLLQFSEAEVFEVGGLIPG